MKIEDFISERIREDKINLLTRISDDKAISAVNHLVYGLYDVLEWHKNWPILIETEPEMEAPKSIDDRAQMLFTFTQRMEWITQQEYINRFGSNPPTAPLLRKIAQRWSDHQDFDESWNY